MGPAKNTLEKNKYFVYNTVCSQYFRYTHPWTYILYSKQCFPHIGWLISENAKKKMILWGSLVKMPAFTQQNQTIWQFSLKGRQNQFSEHFQKSVILYVHDR
jgi:hypothetical protein